MLKTDKMQTEATGLVTTDKLFILLGFMIVVLISYIALHSVLQAGQTASSSTTAAQSASSKSTNSNEYATLSPATVPPKIAECSQEISFDTAGDPGPIQCANGDLNVQAWDSLATLEPTVFSLGYSATAAQVQSALCTDVDATLSDANTKNSSVVEATVYQIAALYYGWSFSINPSAVLTNGTC